MCLACHHLSGNAAPAPGTPGRALLDRLPAAPPRIPRGMGMPRATGTPGNRVLIRGGHVLTLDAAIGNLASGDVLVEGDRIAAIGMELSAPDAQVIDAHGMIVMPGFIDTHHHQFETALRGSLVDGCLIDDGSPGGAVNYLSHILGRLAPAYRPEDVYISELFGAVSQLDAGVTTVLDVSQIHHSPEHSDAAVQALVDSGRRSVLGYFEGHGGDARHPADAARLRSRYFSSDDQRVTMAMGGEVYLPGWRESWRIARDLDLRIVLHAVGSMGLAAQFDELAREGAFTDRHLLIHLTGMSDMVWRAVRDAGSAVSLSVPIEMTMRHGMPPLFQTQAMGIVPSLSSDVECTLTADFFTQMRSTLTLQRALVHDITLAGGKEAPALLTADDVLRFATTGGADALGLGHRTGTLSIGKAADIILLDADAINVAPLNSVQGAVVGLMERSNVDTVLVDGCIRKWRGQLVDVDVAALTGSIRVSRDAIFARAGIMPDLFD